MNKRYYVDDGESSNVLRDRRPGLRYLLPKLSTSNSPVATNKSLRYVYTLADEPTRTSNTGSTKKWVKTLSRTVKFVKNEGPLTPTNDSVDYDRTLSRGIQVTCRNRSRDEDTTRSQYCT